jgi:hypothetical protein
MYLNTLLRFDEIRARNFNISGAQESIPRNRFRQPMQPGGPVRQHYSYSVSSPQRLFKNSSTGPRFEDTISPIWYGSKRYKDPNLSSSKSLGGRQGPNPTEFRIHNIDFVNLKKLKQGFIII